MSLSPSPARQERRPLSVRTVRTTASEDEDVKTGKAWARAVVDPWECLILTLDGGGIRGYATLLMLQHLMSRIAEWENKLQQEEGPVPNSKRHTFNEDELLPCHYFDFMYGTSTGGLIATMLGRLRMSIPQCLEIYRQVGNDLFGHRRSIVPLTTKYRAKPLELAVKRIVQGHCKHHGPDCDGDDWYPWNETKMAPETESEELARDRICQTVCLTATHNGRIDEAYLLRTYDHRYADDVPNWITRYNEGADQIKIWEATRATSAAPFFFKSLDTYVRGELVTFKDGGIRENNPAGAAWSEFVSLYGEENQPGLLLSLGTGRPDESQDGFASAWPGPFGRSKVTKKAAEKFAVFKNVLIKYTEGEDTHKHMRSLARGEHKWYKRLNVSTGLENMKLDNWEKGEWRNPATGQVKVVSGGRSLQRMQDATDTYLARDIDRKFETYAPPKVMLDQAAEKLVRHRRARERTKHLDPNRWDTFMGRWLTGQRQEEDGVLKR